MIEIYGTIGPACADTETLRSMFREGMTGIRLNLSHSSLEESRDLLDKYRKAAEQEGKKADLLIDMQGPELRLKDMKTLAAETGSIVILSEEKGIQIQRFLLEQIHEEDEILIDDGMVHLKVVGKAEDFCRAEVLRGGIISARKSIKLVGRDVDVPICTEADLLNLISASSYGVTAVMQPFVRSREDLIALREKMKACGAGNLRIFAKIENMQGVRNIEEILPEADMIVIARGDLGNDMPLWELPTVQKKLMDVCREHGIPFMVVTQMLASMVNSPIPTRAEVSDIFYAAAYGASAVMVTNETAAGKYPSDVIHYLCAAAHEGENNRF